MADALDTEAGRRPGEADTWARIDVLLSLGIANLESGLSATETVQKLHTAAAGWGIADLTILAAGHYLMIEYVAPDGRAQSRTGIATSLDGINCERLRRLDLAGARIASGSLDAEEAHRVVERATSSSLPWWWTVGGLSVLAFCIGLQVSGNATMALCAAMTHLVVAALGIALANVGMSRIYAVAVQCVLGALLSWGFATLGTISWLDAVGCIAVSWLLLVPLPLVVSVVADAVNTNHLAAGARLASLLLVSSGILLGGLIVVAIGDALVLTHAGRITLPALAIPLSLLFSTLGALANALANNGGRALLPTAAAFGLFTACVNQALIHLAGMPALWSSTVSALVLGFAAAMWSRRSPYPPSVLALMGITGALLPGLVVYQGLATELFRDTGLPSFTQAGLVIVGLGIGTTAGFQLASFFRPRRGAGRP